MARGDVLRVTLPYQTDGHEQRGHRPAIAVQVEEPSTPTLMVVPATGQTSAGRYPFTVVVEPTTRNGFTAPTVLLVFQLRAMDKVRIDRSIGTLEEHYLKQVEAQMREMLGLG